MILYFFCVVILPIKVNKKVIVSRDTNTYLIASKSLISSLGREHSNDLPLK